MARDERPAWVVDPSDAYRLATLEAELARVYERLGACAPDDETAGVLERLASAARSRAQVFLEACALGGEETPISALRHWMEAQSRFEQAASEAAGHGDAALDAFHEEVARLGRDVDVLLLVAGKVLDDG